MSFRSYLWVFFGFVIAVMSSAYSASGEPFNRTGDYITCPLGVASTQLTVPLPQPWWSTSQEGRLRHTAVANVGGDMTLICNYAAYNKTMPVARKMPRRYRTCAALENGFICR